ncbi:MAG: ATP-binding cassette domain-containing protein [Verrucomicrobia bacterium]|nr:ATP-binding cassette domain-containing protein [Verrucomicrobiota bacterium]
MSSSKSSANESVIRVEGVSRRFGAKLALDGVSLNVGSGQVVGLVGANGAGKTTLIKHILGLLAPAIGTVRVFGFDPVIGQRQLFIPTGNNNCR